LTLINAIVNFPKETETRTKIRKEFLDLKMLQILDTLKILGRKEIDTQINVFLEELEEDQQQVSFNNINLSYPLILCIDG
jgi:hypothetical protein